ncbi:MAG TPA: WYL domain-containing protein, partial [Myxococcota bacterium]|nr:WYL domain-containing protein [Myxococcota bacterium]
MSVTDRLGRLLFIVPYVMHRDGVPLAELAETLGVTKAQIQADLDLLCMVGQPPLTPDHLIDLFIEDDVVYVELDQSLSRPLRLTHEEARALVLGAKLVGNLGGLGRALDQVLARLMQHLNPADRDAVQALSERILVQGEDIEWAARAALLRRAIEERREVRASYYSVSSDRQKDYHLKPLALITHGGVDYLVALDVDAEDQEKLFRLDRLGAVVPLGGTFAPPVDFDLERFRTQRLYFGAGNLSAEVRFAPRLARQVRERF